MVVAFGWSAEAACMTKVCLLLVNQSIITHFMSLLHPFYNTVTSLFLVISQKISVIIYLEKRLEYQVLLHLLLDLIIITCYCCNYGPIITCHYSNNRTMITKPLLLCLGWAIMGISNLPKLDGDVPVDRHFYY